MSTFADDGITATPLSWPAGWKRTARRATARFGRHSFARARDEVLHQLRLMGVGDWNVVISTNLALRRDGLPYSGQAQPADTGVAVYFKLKGKPRVLACDRWDKIEHNAWAVAKHVEALRGIERWSVGTLEQAFTGYIAIPAKTSARSCWEVLGLSGVAATPELIEGAFKAQARTRHPDVGGTHDAMTELNEARKAALKELK